MKCWLTLWKERKQNEKHKEENRQQKVAQNHRTASSHYEKTNNRENVLEGRRIKTASAGNQLLVTYLDGVH